MQKTVDFLQSALKGSWRKNTAIASNIANYNTPGYKRRTVDFESALREQINLRTMRTTHEKHFKTVKNFGPVEFTEYGTRYRVDGNNVDINIENVELAKNAVYFQALVDEVNSQFQRIKNAMRIGK